MTTFRCVAPGAAKADIKLGTVETRLDKLEKLADQKVDNSVSAEEIENMKQDFRQQLAELKFNMTTNNSGTIKYSGGGWIVLGSCLMAVIFLGTGYFILRLYKNQALLKLVTTAISKSDETSQRAVKDQIEHETSNGGPFGAKHKEALANFVKKNI
jgi:cytochrome c-type biogenesis protein CcmH/NrfG